MEKFMLFTEEEFRARAEKARTIMAKEGIDACIFSKGSNITYFSGYQSYLFEGDFRPFFFILPLNDDPVFVVPAFEAPGALRIVGARMPVHGVHLTIAKPPIPLRCSL